MRIAMILLMAIATSAAPAVATEPGDSRGGSWVETPYQERNVLFDFYLKNLKKLARHYTGYAHG